MIIQEPVKGLKVAQHHLAVKLSGDKTIQASVESGTNPRFVPDMSERMTMQRRVAMQGKNRACLKSIIGTPF